MNEVMIFALAHLLVITFIAFSFTDDLKNITRQHEENLTPNYCIQSHPTYNQEKCQNLNHWRTLQEELVLSTSEWSWDCKCPKKTENNPEEENRMLERQLCEEVCGKDYGLRSSMESVCNPESAVFSKAQCKNNILYKWLTDGEGHQKQIDEEDVWLNQNCNCPEAPEEAEDPLHKWERLQCERGCREAYKAKDE